MRRLLMVLVALALAGAVHADCSNPLYGPGHECVSGSGSSQYGKWVLNYSLSNSPPSGWKLIVSLDSAAGGQSCGGFNEPNEFEVRNGRLYQIDSYCNFSIDCGAITDNRSGLHGTLLVPCSKLGGSTAGTCVIQATDAYGGEFDYCAFTVVPFEE